MPRYQGPCVECGIAVDRIIKHGRGLRCLDCALVASQEAQRRMAARQGPEYHASVAAGREFARQVSRGVGGGTKSG